MNNTFYQPVNYRTKVTNWKPPSIGVSVNVLSAAAKTAAAAAVVVVVVVIFLGYSDMCIGWSWSW
jgi:hypothetical protein